MKIARLQMFCTTFQKLLVGAIISCISFSLSFAQETKEFNGKYKLSKQLEGRAAYTYIVDDNGKIKDGPFLFTYAGEDSLKPDFIEKYKLQGDFERGKKSGEWEFSYHSLSPDKEEFIEGYAIKQTASGEVFQIESDFKDGSPQGKWTSIKLKVENSLIRDTLSYSHSEFKEGKFVNEIRTNNKTHQLAGSLDDKGYLDGDWIIFHNDSSKAIIEYRKYESGILTSHTIEINDEKYVFAYEGMANSDSEDSLLTSLPLDETYYEILKLADVGKINPSDIFSEEVIKTIQNASYNLILNSFNSFRKYNDFYIWDNDVQIELPKVRVKKYPFTDKEKQNISSSNELLEETNELLNDFLKEPQVEISMNSNDTIAKYHEVYNHYQKAFSKIEETFEELQKPAFEYVDRSKLLPKVFEGTQYPDEIIYEIDNSKKESKVNFPESLSSDDATIASIYDQLEHINKEIKSIDKKVQPILKKEQQRADLAEDESDLVHKRDSIVQVYGNEDNLNKYQQEIAERVINYVKKEFKSYTKQSLEKRVETLSSTLSCFDDFLKLYDQLDGVPSKISKIKELYTRTIWNPFTMTDMDEIVKERVYNAYREILIDYLLDRLKDNINCDNLTAKMKDLDNLFEKMVELREQDTSELEREIKRESDPQTLIKAFELKLNKQ